MRRFFSELDKLQHEVVEMAGIVRNSIRRSVRCLTERNPDFADQVFRDEALVNQAEIAVDDLATKLVSLDAPVASDMRLIIAVLKINTDLERMGDLAVNLAKRSLTLLEAPPLAPPLPVEEMSQLVENMVDRCMTAFTNRDDTLARTVLTSDDQVDSIRNEIYDDLSQRMENQQLTVRHGLGYMFVARNLERIADHATNIAEDVIFLVKGIDVRHHSEQR
jgi:phosphate transport system protein